MKKIRNTIYAIGLLLMCNPLIAQDTHQEELLLVDGEELVYKIFYNWKFIWVPAGEVTFNIKYRDEYIELNVDGISYPSYDSFFKVRDHYVSRLDKENFLPINFRRDILEGKYVRYDSIAFNQDSFTVEEYFGKSEATAKLFNFQLKSSVLDILSAIYHLRSIDVEKYDKSDKVPFKIFFDKELFNLNLNFAGPTTKKIKNIGKMDCWLFQVNLLEGKIFHDGDTMNIWVSKDENKIPLLIESPINVGSIKAILKSSKNLKEPIDYIKSE